MRNKLVKISSIIVILIAIMAISIVMWKNSKNEEVIPTEKEQVENTDNWQVYENTKYTYKIKCPKGWIMGNNAQADIASFYAKELDLTKNGGNAGMANLTIYAYIPTGITAEDFIKQDMNKNHQLFYENKRLGNVDVDIYRVEGYPETEGSEIYSYVIKNGNNVYIGLALYKQQIFDIFSTFKFIK